MKFPSVKTLADSAGRTVSRFPFEVLFALVGTIATIINIELDNINRVGENWCVRVIMMANIGLLLTLSATLYAESRALPSIRKNILRLVAAVIAVGVLFIINPGLRQADYLRFVLLSLSAHLLVAFAAFTGQNSVQGFWQFNKTLFLRVLTAALYSVVLGLGLSAAIGAVNYLFGFDFEFDTFQILWTWIGGMFSTIFFLAGVPANFAELNTDESYPKALKIFTQYVLIPLATVYVLILLAYEVKIISEWNLPKGAVSYLILGYSVFGILSLLLVYPVREQEENKWLKTYARSFYFLMIPLLGLLFAAVGVRVFRYGITEPRYFLIVLACWLLFITLYFLLAKRQNIKLIPITLCVATLLTVYGPQSAFSIAEYSQLEVITSLLKKNNALKNGKAIPVKKLKGADGRRMLSVLEYLINNHDLDALQPLFTENLEKVGDSLSTKKSEYYVGLGIGGYELRRQKIDWVRQRLNLGDWGNYPEDDKYVHAKELNTEYNFHIENTVLEIAGYNYIVPAPYYYSESDTSGFTQIQNGVKFLVTSKKDKRSLLKINGTTFDFNTQQIAKDLLLQEKLYTQYAAEKKDMNRDIREFILPQEKLKFTKQAGGYTVTLFIKNITFYKTPGPLEIQYIEASYLVKKD